MRKFKKKKKKKKKGGGGGFIRGNFPGAILLTKSTHFKSIKKRVLF